jgi:hypothetical protein
MYFATIYSCISNARWRTARGRFAFRLLFFSAVGTRMNKRLRNKTSPAARANRKPNRRNIYGAKLTTEICAGIAGGKSLRTVCRAKKMPHPSTVFLWLAKYPDFREQYRLAMEQRAFAIIEETLTIADDASRDYQHGSRAANVEHIQRTKLRVAARQFAFAGLRPKKYGVPWTDNDSGAAGGTSEQVIRWANTEAEATSDPSEKTMEPPGEPAETSEKS